MQLHHFPSTATPAEIAAAIRENGYAIVDDLAPLSLMDAIETEMSPYVENTLWGPDAFLGSRTRRTGALVARSPAARELIMNPTVLGTMQIVLGHASAFQLNLTEIISVYPGSPAQVLHIDEIGWDSFPFPKDYEVNCNTLWALTDYTDEMGATRVVPRSHICEAKTVDVSQAVAAEMSRGSALFYTGKLFHGAGANRSSRTRQACLVGYAVGWLRQEENQYLSTPIDIARTLPDALLKVMGYQAACEAIGYIRDEEDPMVAIREPAERKVIARESLDRRVLKS
jgi:ectoine hydroxylase-related dioxygenase (phytanoyl-CoA dioxygenase family)